MTGPEEMLFHLLSTSNPVTELTGDRIRPIMLRQEDGLGPGVVIERIATRRFDHLLGASRFVRAMIQVTCLAPTFAKLWELKELVRERLQRFPRFPFGDSELMAVNLENERSVPSGPSDGRDTPRYGWSFDLDVIVSETARGHAIAV